MSLLDNFSESLISVDFDKCFKILGGWLEFLFIKVGLSMALRYGL